MQEARAATKPKDSPVSAPISAATRLAARHALRVMNAKRLAQGDPDWTLQQFYDWAIQHAISSVSDDRRSL